MILLSGEFKDNKYNFEVEEFMVWLENNIKKHKSLVTHNTRS